MILINLRATLKKLHKNSETYTQHNYLFKTVFLVLVKFICTHICYTSTSLFFSFHLSGPLNNNKALYMKIAVCINTLPQQCSLDLRRSSLFQTPTKSMIWLITSQQNIVNEWALSTNGTTKMVSSTFYMINFLLFIWSIWLLYGLLALSTELIT